MMTYEHFEEYVKEAVARHISRDRDLVQADLDWEVRNLTAALAEKLRINGFSIPPYVPPKERDLSEFEGM